MYVAAAAASVVVAADLWKVSKNKKNEKWRARKEEKKRHVHERKKPETNEIPVNGAERRNSEYTIQYFITLAHGMCKQCRMSSIVFCERFHWVFPHTPTHTHMLTHGMNWGWGSGNESTGMLFARKHFMRVFTCDLRFNATCTDVITKPSGMYSCLLRIVFVEPKRTKCDPS